MCRCVFVCWYVHLELSHLIWYWELNLGYAEEELSVISLALGRQNWWICELKVIPVHTASSRPARAP